MRSLHEIEKHLAEEAQSLPAIRHPAIPKEFGDDIKVNKASISIVTLRYFQLLHLFHSSNSSSVLSSVHVIH